MASSVDFPEPEAPTIATASPDVTPRSISCRMTRSLSPLLTVLPMPRAESTEVSATARVATAGSVSRRFIFLFAFLVTALLPGWSAAAGGTILVYGDSLSAAYGIAQERGWVALLEARLKREKANYSVANASISGETTSGGLSRLKKVLERYKPAVTVIEL